MLPARGAMRRLLFALVPAGVVLIALLVAPPGALPSYDRLRDSLGLQSPTGILTGRVLLADRPLGQVIVELHDRRGLVASSLTGPDGSFGRLELPVGEYRVAIRRAQAPVPAAVTRAPRWAGPPHAYLIATPPPGEATSEPAVPQRYHDAESSPLRVQVRRGEHHHVDLVLTP